jgi:hypothetical protein
MKTAMLTRREALRLALLAGAAAAGGVALVVPGCDNDGPAGEVSCTDTSRLSERDLETRKNEKYVEKSTTAGETCSTCRYFLPGGGNSCGKCTKIMGPINPKGHCELWEKAGA